MLKTLGNYEILAEIGRGGMGIVYQALDQRNKRMVAIKQLILDNVDPAKQREFKDRFKREAMMASKLDHPNIVSVFDVSVGSDDDYYYVMEYLEGHSLAREIELKGGHVTPQEFLPILRQVAEGLAYAHSLNVVHRDVKPDNIFILDTGRVKLTDFGIARTVDFEQTHLTKTGVMLGTLAYVSPEQLHDAKNVDHRADIFSLGIVSYECLSGRLPFTGDGIATTVIKILSSEPDPLHMIVPTLSVDVAAVISKAMRKKARDRQPSVLDFLKDYERAVESPAKPVFDPTSTSISMGAVASAPSEQRISRPGIPLDAPVGGGRYPGGGPFRVPSLTPHKAQKIDDTAKTRVSSPSSYYLVKPLAQFGKQGEGKGQFLEPSVICAKSGRIVVADTSTRSVQIFTADGRWFHTIAPKGDARNSATGGGSMTKPSGIAIDFKGRIYACDSSDHFIRIFDSSGAFVKEIQNKHGKGGGLSGLVADSTGLLYAADTDNGCLQVFQADLGTWLRKIASRGTSAGQLQMPSGVAVDRANQIYVVDYSTARISVFNKAGIFVRAFGGKGTGNGLFNVPRGVAVDKTDRIYVADSINHRIQVFGPAGDWLFSFGGKGNDLGKFIAPSGIAIDPETNCLYVADRGNCRVQVFEILS